MRNTQRAGQDNTTDSSAVQNVITHHTTVLDKRLQLNTMCMRVNYVNDERTGGGAGRKVLDGTDLNIWLSLLRHAGAELSTTQVSDKLCGRTLSVSR